MRWEIFSVLRGLPIPFGDRGRCGGGAPAEGVAEDPQGAGANGRIDGAPEAAGAGGRLPPVVDR